MNPREQPVYPPASEAAMPGEDEAQATRLAPEDFYCENGLLVFTATYHLKRGYCCNSGCRHCPFR